MKDYETIRIDELKICYIADTDALAQFEQVEVSIFVEVYGYKFYRMMSDRFRFFFDVCDEEGPVAQMKFGHYTDLNDSTTYVYFKVLNHILYDEDHLRNILELPEAIGMIFNNFTAIDLAFDNRLNIPSLIKKMMRDKEITTIINGKAIQDRKALLQGVMFEYSSSLNRLAHPTITVKQKKAIANKSDGITVQAYDKKAEIDNHSNKQYILEHYGNPKRLYRLEVRLHYQELKDYFSRQRIIPTTETIFDQSLLQDMFFYHLGAVIRFSKGRKRLSWSVLLGCSDEE